jgi:hypothetical protein
MSNGDAFYIAIRPNWQARFDSRRRRPSQMTDSTDNTEVMEGVAGSSSPRPSRQPKARRDLPQRDDDEPEGNDDDDLVSSALSYEEIVHQLTTRLTVDVEVAGAAFGMGRGRSYKAAHLGQLPALRMGHKLTVPTAPLRAMLGIDASGNQVAPAMPSAAPPPAMSPKKPNSPNRKVRRAPPR